MAAQRIDRGRFHRHRRRLGGLHGRGAAERGPGDPGAAARSRRRGQNRWIHIPLGFGKTFADPSVNWCYETEPDAGAADRKVFWPRGKVLGGSSSINGMVYIRGQAEDFDHWRQLGNTGWSFDDVLPYFKRAEDQVRGGDEFHGTRRAALRVRCREAPDRRSLHRQRDGARLSAQRRFQRRQPGRRRLSPDDDAQRQALLDRGRLSAPGDAAGPICSVVTNALTEKIVVRGRRAVGVTYRQDGADPHRARGERDHPVRRRDQLAATAAAVRHRPGGASGRARDRGGAGSARRRAEPAGPLLGADQVQRRAAGHGQRRDAEQSQEAQGRIAILHVQEPARWR